MKKIIIPIIIAAVLGVGGGVTAVMLNKPVVADKNEALPEIKTGNYYLNGEKNSGIYFELTNNYIALRVEGNSVEKFKDALRKDSPGFTDDELTAEASRLCDDYCAENPYVISVFGTTEIPYQIMIHWIEGDSGPRYSGVGFPYDGNNKIRTSVFGEFILIE